ncbi:hypothetical protein CsSME_00035374 [Camellia sinensis var. sinensis]
MNVVIYLILLFVGIGFLVIIYVCIVGRAFKRGFMNASTATESSGRFGSISMSQDDLKGFRASISKQERKEVVQWTVLFVWTISRWVRSVDCCLCASTVFMPGVWICGLTSTDSWKGGSISGDESRHFSGIELRESQTTEWELRESQRAEIDNFLALEIDHLSESGIEATESQAVSQVGFITLIHYLQN